MSSFTSQREEFPHDSDDYDEESDDEEEITQKIPAETSEQW
jgi:hypothetical protein